MDPLRASQSYNVHQVSAIVALAGSGAYSFALEVEGFSIFLDAFFFPGFGIVFVAMYFTHHLSGGILSTSNLNDCSNRGGVAEWKSNLNIYYSKYVMTPVGEKTGMYEVMVSTNYVVAEALELREASITFF